MTSFAIAFLLGDLFLQTFASLPSLWLTGSVLLASVIAYLLLRSQFAFSYLILALALGFTITAWYAHRHLLFSLPEEMEGVPLLVTGHIASLSENETWDTSFYLNLEQIASVKANLMTIPRPIPLLRLAWPTQSNMSAYHAMPHWRVGDRWQLWVRLKKMHGLQSPGAFDMEAFALQKNLRASGYILPGMNNRFLGHDVWFHWIDQWRELLRNQLTPLLPKTTTSPWLLALLIGEHQGIPDDSWQVLRKTGTNHLMAIAGLHIGMLTGVAFYLVTFIWRRIPALALRIPTSDAGMVAALLVAAIYSALAGFSLPTERASMMLGILGLFHLLRREVSRWTLWSAALMGALLLNPLSVLTDSFWLSFSTIVLIIYGMDGRLRPRGLWWRWGRVQWVISFGLMPVSLIIFQTCSGLSLLANALAIPWLTLIILPLAFLGLIGLPFSETLTAWFLSAADFNLRGLWACLTWLSQQQLANWNFAVPSWPLAISLVGAFLLWLLPRGMPGRWLSLIWLMPVLFYEPTHPALGELRLGVLDVGQGLSLVVQTANHLLVYDAGPRLSPEQDMGEKIVVPYLLSLHAKQIDELVISHGDNDHLGGAATLMKMFPVKSISTSVPEKIPSKVTHNCWAGQHWQWDEVNFTFLYPNQDTLPHNNDHSCVLRIDNGKQSILLTGDIEKEAEKNMLTQSLLPTTILIAPHHGSKTSGVPQFMASLKPVWVVYATGYRNRYHFPNPSIVAAYNQLQTKSLNMPDTGTIVFDLRQDQSQPLVYLYRRDHHHYWMG